MCVCLGCAFWRRADERDPLLTCLSLAAWNSMRVPVSSWSTADMVLGPQSINHLLTCTVQTVCRRWLKVAHKFVKMMSHALGSGQWAHAFAGSTTTVAGVQHWHVAYTEKNS